MPKEEEKENKLQIKYSSSYISLWFAVERLLIDLKQDFH